MFTLLRQMLKPILIAAIIAFVGMIWASLGKGMSIMDDPRMNAAIVDGTPISRTDYQFALDNYLKKLREARGGELAAAEEIHARQLVLDELIRNQVLLAEADRRDIVVTDEEVVQYIKYDPLFRDAQGGIDANKYNMYVQRMSATNWTIFERQKRELLLLAKLRDGVSTNLRATISDLRNYYQSYYKRYTLQQVLIQPEAFITAERVAAHYREHAADYPQPLQVHARHILIKVAPEAPEEDVAAAKRKAQNLRDQIESGVLDFAAAARQYSDDPSNKDKGGDLGTFERGRMVPEFDAVVFDLDTGTISAVTKTEFGFHIIEVLERIENVPYPLAKVERSIRRTLTGDSETAAARARAADVARLARQGLPFATLARQYSDAASAETDGVIGTIGRYLDPELFPPEKFAFLNDELVNNYFIIREVSETLDRIPIGGVSDPIKSPFGFHLVKVTAAAEADPAGFPQFRGRVESDINSRLQSDVFDRWYEQVKLEHDIKTLLEAEFLNPSDTEAAAGLGAGENPPAPQF